MNTKTLIQKLRDAGIKQADVARALELPTSTVCRIFAGTRDFTLEEAVTLVQAVGPQIGVTFPAIDVQTSSD